MNMGLLRAILTLDDQMTPGLDQARRAAMAVAAVVAAAGAAMAVALFKATKEALSFADAIDNQRAATQVGAEALQLYNVAAERAGQGAAAITTAIQRMQRAIGAGSAETDKAIANLNLSVGQLKALAPEKQFELIFQRLGDIRDPAEKAANAMILLGRSGANLLALSGDALPQLRDQMRELGLVIDKDTIAAVDRLEEDLDLLSRVAAGTWRQIGVGVARSTELRAAVLFATDVLGGFNKSLGENENAITGWIDGGISLAVENLRIFLLIGNEIIGMSQKMEATFEAMKTSPFEAALSGENPFAGLSEQFADIEAQTKGAAKLIQASFLEASAAAKELASSMENLNSSSVAAVEPVAELARQQTALATASEAGSFQLQSLVSVMVDWQGKLVQSGSAARLWQNIVSESFADAGTAAQEFAVVNDEVGGLVALQASEMAAAFSFFGVKTRSELEATLATALAAFEKMKTSGEAVPKAIAVAEQELADLRALLADENVKIQISTGEAIQMAALSSLSAFGSRFKAAAIAEAMINTFLGISRAFKDYIFPASAIIAASVAAIGFANVAKITGIGGFREGTRDLDFQDFGRETFIPVHGREAIIPQGGGHELAREIAAGLSGGGGGSGDVGSGGGGSGDIIVNVQVKGLLSQPEDVANAVVDGLDRIFELNTGGKANKIAKNIAARNKNR